MLLKVSLEIEGERETEKYQLVRVYCGDSGCLLL